MKLYVCWGTFPVPWPRSGSTWRPKGHPCKKAPDITSGRKEVKRLTGESFVPVLVLDDGEVIKDSKNIVTWARNHPAGGRRA
jgi:hypothetical protein